MNNIQLSSFTPEQKENMLNSSALYKIRKINPDWADKVQQMATKYNVAPYKIVYTIQRESNFNPNATNPNSTATGLGQFVKGTAHDLGINPLDPMQSIEGIAHYFNMIHKAGVPSDFASETQAYINGPAGYKKMMANNDNGNTTISVDSSPTANINQAPIQSTTVMPHLNPEQMIVAEENYNPDDSLAHRIMQNMRKQDNG